MGAAGLGRHRGTARTMTGDTVERVENAWWCDLHQDVHLGEIQSFNMEHRMGLHPMYAHVNFGRRRAFELKKAEQ